ncbi:VWA domain-containing protein [Marinobacter mobilis]|uniref:Ca-activated chloride channel family protein n=1 Tax=Marinobacter mobilis TaxID=488533 RepID=A0A1H2XYC3_9GAMM|nr:VWA domain-containing protein [Marinobacter mobilis]SDW97800.1 Ca-activated chloride channel family protein [Marinobacter mobilis]
MPEALLQFHFLRPWGLLIVLAGALLPFGWRWLGHRRDAASQLIAPHLLPHLTLHAGTRQRLRPVHGLSALLVITGLAVSGPAWEKTLPAALDDQTRLTVILDLSESMGPSQGNNTLALGQARVQALSHRQPGWHIGLIAYGHSAHRVLPESRDSDLLALYLNSLEAGMIPGSGRHLAAALALATPQPAALQPPRTVIVVTDRLAPLAPELPATDSQVLVLAPGAALATTTAASVLDSLAAEAKPMGSLEDDVRWLERQVHTHVSRHQTLDETLKWRDGGYWLVWPALLLGLLSIRRGWRLQYSLIPLVLTLAPAPPVSADAWTDAFLTPDQQGRLAFEAGRYSEAQQQFQDPYLRGLAAYRAADFSAAVAQFRQLDSPEAWFYLGNCLARQLEFSKARVAYKTALDKRSPWPAAEANLALVTRLGEALDQQRQASPDIGADDFRFDSTNDNGVATELMERPAMTGSLWLDNLNTSASTFLRRKFVAEQQASAGEQP